jgi:hypothetical protein
MIVAIDFRDALQEFSDSLGVDRRDTDSMWYVADLFDMLLKAALDSNKEYKKQIDGLVSKLQAETGEPRSICQSSCDLAITQVLNKMDEIFANVRHIDLYKTSKDVNRANGSMSVYTINVGELSLTYI